MIRALSFLWLPLFFVSINVNATFDPGSPATITDGGFGQWEVAEGVDSDVVFYAYDSSGTNGTYYANLSNLGGVTVDGLFSGQSAAIDLSSNGFQSHLYDTWSITAASYDMSPTDIGLFVGNELGAIFASDTAYADIAWGADDNYATNLALQTSYLIEQIDYRFFGQDFGMVSPFEFVDLSNPVLSPIYPLNDLSPVHFGETAIASLFLAGIYDPTPEADFEWHEIAQDTIVSITPLTRDFYSDVWLTSEYLLINPIPLPAGVWMFFSAISALFVWKGRRKLLGR